MEVVVNYALKNSNKLFIFINLCSLIKVCCIITPYILNNKIICLQLLFFNKKIKMSID